MSRLKPLSKEAIPRALEKAERYRLLNEPQEAESICMDILLIEPDHQKAMITLLLALTDQFDKGFGIQRAREILPSLREEYQQHYYAGLICERAAKAILHRGGHGSGMAAYDWLQQAMNWYEKAEAIRPAGNDDAILRWNACERMIQRYNLQAAPEEISELPLE